MVTTLQTSKQEGEKDESSAASSHGLQYHLEIVWGDACKVRNLLNEHETADRPITSVSDFTAQRGIGRNTAPRLTVVWLSRG